MAHKKEKMARTLIENSYIHIGDSRQLFDKIAEVV